MTRRQRVRARKRINKAERSAASLQLRRDIENRNRALAEWGRVDWEKLKLPLSKAFLDSMRYRCQVGG